MKYGMNLFRLAALNSEYGLYFIKNYCTKFLGFMTNFLQITVYPAISQSYHICIFNLAFYILICIVEVIFLLE
jgi:hypothetical protein